MGEETITLELTVMEAQATLIALERRRLDGWGNPRQYAEPGQEAEWKVQTVLEEVGAHDF